LLDAKGTDLEAAALGLPHAHPKNAFFAVDLDTSMRPVTVLRDITDDLPPRATKTGQCSDVMAQRAKAQQQTSFKN
jgi:hypothetical protein